MNKKTKVLLGIVAVLIVITTSITALILIHRKDGTETSLENQQPIKGPDVGEGGNDFDNTFRSLAVSPTNSNLIFIGNEGNGIFRSKDGGETWEWLRNGLMYSEAWYPEVYEIVIDENNESIVLAATTNGPSPTNNEEYDFPLTAGVYRSEDGGDSWTQHLEGLPNSAVTSLVQMPNAEDTFVIGLDGLRISRSQYSHLETVGGLYISEDGGKSWSALPIPEEGKQFRYAKLKVRGTDDDPVLYTTGVDWENMDSSIGLLRGDNNGQTWTKINPSDGLFAYFEVSSDGNTIYTSGLDQESMFVSDDRGENWSTISHGGTGALKFYPNSTEKVLFGMGNDLHLTEDGFETSKKVLTGTQGINDIEFFKGNPDIVYVSATGLEVYKSTDGGETFKFVANLREFIDNYE